MNMCGGSAVRPQDEASYMTLSPTDRSLFLIALRVLTQFNQGTASAPEDLGALKASARPGEKRFRLDVLACAIIQRELDANPITK